MTLGLLDSLLHRVGLPYWRICDQMDLWLGVPDTPQNFPRRHGYRYMHHVWSGSSGYPSDNLRCRNCGRRMADSGPCVLEKVS